MLQLLFVETALELVPKELITHPSVRRNAERRGKRPHETLLNRSLHHFAMKKTHIYAKRGRPDIIHFCLLAALGSPLNKSGNLKITIQTVNNEQIAVDPSTRIPRDCNRFNSLMEQLLLEGKIPTNSDKPLMYMKKANLPQIKKDLNPSSTIAFTSHGKFKPLKEICMKHPIESKPLMIIGAYPIGPMGEEIITHVDETYSIYHEPLEAWIVVSRLLHECEKKLNIF
jgi:rRNA small subunit pseudouridine methyltransferase Nep1